MSYADVVAEGPKQPPEEARAPPMPEVEKTESEATSIVDVGSPHISSVKSDFEDQATKTQTQAIRKEHEAEDKGNMPRKPPMLQAMRRRRRVSRVKRPKRKQRLAARNCRRTETIR